ncbi:MAG: hypothetical protein PHX09_03755 [Clostridia bacterium]|nr:hypothetical protein [Clostridia bacterium]MDD4686380.1 hypothetical protein [Clostridia bacterium]
MLNLAVNFLQGFMFAELPDVDPEGQWGWVLVIVDAIKEVLWPILIVVGAAGMLYAVIIGVNMARADSTEKREEAKKRLINVIVGLAIIIALILFFQLFISVILPAFFGTAA